VYRTNEEGKNRDITSVVHSERTCTVSAPAQPINECSMSKQDQSSDHSIAPHALARRTPRQRPSKGGMVTTISSMDKGTSVIHRLVKSFWYKLGQSR
jgi:hypothetical protein